MLTWNIFTLIRCLCCTSKHSAENTNGGNQHIENSKRPTRDMEFQKRTIIMSNKKDQESFILTPICIAFILFRHMIYKD